MSTYGKPSPSQLHGYDTGRPYQEGSFPYSTSSYGSQSVPSSGAAPGFLHAPQLTPMAYPPQSRPPFDVQSGPYLNVGSTPIPEVTSYSPSSGSANTKICVSITSLYELMTSSTPIFFLTFGRRKCPASLAKVSQHGGVCQYTVSAEVPELAATSWSSSQVPIDLFMESGDGDVMAKVNVGHFTFVAAQHGSGSAQEPSRKRKLSTDSGDLMKSPLKRTTSQLLRPKEEYGSTYGYAAEEGPSYSSYLQPGQQYTSIMPQYNRSLGGYPGQPSPRLLNYGCASSTTTSPPTIKAQSPHVTGWNPAYGAIGHNMRRNSVLSDGGVTRTSLSSLHSPAGAANPPLIRTSTLQQSPSPASTPHGGHPGQHFNAYALYSNKAKLEINGDLDAMAQNWSGEEWDAKRRLVQFRRSQSGSTITTTFQPVSVDERPPTSVCISCIYWEEKQESFVTSVDTIYLLEQLVAARFTVEEKNRIRRNLEGFRPLTVSKGKQDSEEFFKVIMGFPAPKPRNIEKDVKVFHWKDLASALKKIISKYSASPSSTIPPAPALLTPVSSTGYGTEGSSAGISYAADHHGHSHGQGHGPVSPRSISGSTTSTAYASSIPARVLSPRSQKSLGLTGGPPDLRVALPHNPHESAGQWGSGGGGGQHHMQSSPQFAPLGSQSSRSSWDMSSFLENSPATAGPGSASAPPQSLNQSLSYSRSIVDVGVALPGGNNRLARSLPSQQQQQQQHQQQQSHQIPPPPRS
ncbi:Uncharacterized protein BP5553_04188 [Venustampulla echinocandica]|uniref:DUF7082 domain-containing protein n=1 Tax=Venustampulla echinocandica TaxID=2656787 RepID=A0A370TWJ9_9HELO|nr:Uncharacterized protein BP5553_04188 [Venustampulla echinocandica]RDL39848.1 Uncharacterized protein BP5553_04188 [Venustampulla echinocandica]